MTADVRIEYRIGIAFVWARAMCALRVIVGPHRAFRLAWWGVEQFAHWRVVSPTTTPWRRYRMLRDSPYRERVP